MRGGAVVEGQGGQWDLLALLEATDQVLVERADHGLGATVARFTVERVEIALGGVDETQSGTAGSVVDFVEVVGAHACLMASATPASGPPSGRKTAT